MHCKPQVQKYWYILEADPEIQTRYHFPTGPNTCKGHFKKRLKHGSIFEAGYAPGISLFSCTLLPFLIMYSKQSFISATWRLQLLAVLGSYESAKQF